MAAQPYSFTEKKRIRKSFAKRRVVQAVPYLLQTQLESYTQFLQLERSVADRKDEGLQAAFTSIFPITSHNQMAGWSSSATPSAIRRSTSWSASSVA